MPIGLQNATNITFENITSIMNVTEPTELFINVNHIIYGGYLYFVLLFITWAISLWAAEQVERQLLVNAMYGGAFVTILSFFLRAVEIRTLGVPEGLLTDFQMWVFPLLTIILATINWLFKPD